MKRYQLPVEENKSPRPLYHFSAYVRGWNRDGEERGLTQVNDVELLRFREYNLLRIPLSLPFFSFVCVFVTAMY